MSGISCGGLVRPALLVLAVPLLLHAAQQPQPATSETPPRFVLDLKGTPAQEVLDSLAKSEGVVLEVIGDARVPVTGKIASQTLEGALLALASKARFLVSRRDERFIVYAAGAEQQLGNRSITYNHKLRAMPTEAAIVQLASRSAADVRFSAVPHLNSILFSGPLAGVREAVDFLNTFDEASPLVLIELLVVEYFHGHSFDWNIDITSATNAKLSAGSISPGNLTSNVAFTYNFVDRLAPSFKLNLNALVIEESARVVTNPHIAVRSAEEGTIKLAEELHVVISNPGSTFGNILTLQTLEAGVTLRITPRVVSEKLIMLDVNGEVAVFLPSGTDQFSIDRNTILSKVNVADNQTLIIGGLIRGKAQEEDRGIPYLRRIPLLGYLFKSQSRSTDYVETVMYITPRLTIGDHFNQVRMVREVNQRIEELDAKHKTRKQERPKRP